MSSATTQTDEGRMDDRLGLFDPVALQQLRHEIQRLRDTGAVINVGHHDDEAYCHPDEIRAVFEHLRGLDTELANVPRTSPRWHYSPSARSRARRHEQEHLDRHRVAWLYGPEHTNSIPWYEQRGRAAALLTITGAHELSDDTGIRKYPTMSGPLDKRVLDHNFEHEVPHIGGLTLKEAVAVGEITFVGRERATAHRIAEKRVNQLTEFVHAPVSTDFRRIARFCTDSLGIRSRKHIVAQRLQRALAELDTSRPLMMSFGCGTALPMLEVLAERRAQEKGSVPHLILLDQDPLALAAAVTLATQMGLDENIEVHCRRLFDRWGRPLDLQSVLKGRRLHIAEDSGLREYLPDRIYRLLTTQIWRSLVPGGLMSTGNMNSSRPQREFLHGMMGWKPTVQMRSIRHGLDLHAKAGVPRTSTSTTVTPEGVYSLFFSVKARQ